MFKNKLETKFQNAIDDILKQNEILAGITTTDSELISSMSELDLTSQNSGESKDSSDDESVINSVEEFHQTTISTASTLPFCDCKLKMHLKTDNYAICRKKVNPCSKTVNIEYYPTISKYE